MKDWPMHLEDDDTKESDRKEPQKEGDEYELKNVDEATVGRRSKSDVTIVDTTVSGIHFVIVPVFDKVKVLGKLLSCTITDKSSNGTWLNGTEMVKDTPTTLWYGDIISLCQSHTNEDDICAVFEFKESLFQVLEDAQSYGYETP